MGDKYIIQELAKQYMEFALSEKQQKANARMKATNDLLVVRPPVLIDEIPWHELECEELRLRCADPRAQKVETYLRRSLYRKKYFKSDLIMPAEWPVRMSYDISPLGLSAEETRSDGKGIEYADVMEDESCLERINPPAFKARPEKDAANMAYYTELFSDSMPVRLCGVNYLYSAFWDVISRLRGVTPIYEDMYDRPEYLHAIMEKLVGRTAAQLDFIEEKLHVDPHIESLHCTPAAVSGLAEDGLKATWYRGMSQCFSNVSPAMFKEFELDYIMPLASRFAYTYYGCCEPLDDRIELLKQIPNLRKLGVSPWANVNRCAEQIGANYVLSRKPNPAHVAHATDPEVIRREAEESVKACLLHGCPMDYVLKDITTVSGNPRNLIVWAETVSDVMDEYYGAD
jgi:hypothetical protein